jgi:L-iditol 2-dehydrogenase
MERMKAARFYGQGDIRVESLAIPAPGPGEVLVRVRRCGICGSDLRTFQHGSSGGRYRTPRTLGHEFSGVVEALGEGVAGLHPGDRVAAAPASACGACEACRHGSPTLCANALDFGTTQEGAHAECVVIPAPLVSQGGLVHLPDDLSDESASLLEPLGTSFRGLVTRGRIQPGETVVILGDGPIGLIQVMLAKLLGAGMVVSVGHHADRLALAKEFGASAVVEASGKDISTAVRRATGTDGADLVVVSAPSPDAVEQSLQLARGGGRLIIFGGVPRGSTVEIDPNRIHYGELEVIGSLNCTTEEFRTALGHARRLPLDRLITHRVPLDRVLEGYRLMAERVALKAVVVMDSNPTRGGGLAGGIL